MFAYGERAGHGQDLAYWFDVVELSPAVTSAAREVALTKPIIVIKPGRSEQAAKAAASHTGSLTGSDEVLQAATTEGPEEYRPIIKRYFHEVSKQGGGDQ